MSSKRQRVMYSFSQKGAPLNLSIGLNDHQSQRLDTPLKQAMTKIQPKNTKNSDIVSCCVFVLSKFSFVCGMMTSLKKFTGKQS